MEEGKSGLKLPRSMGHIYTLSKHHTSFHMSAITKHPFIYICFNETFFQHEYLLHQNSLSPVCPRKTSFGITEFPKKPEVSTSDNDRNPPTDTLTQNVSCLQDVQGQR